ncbi:hypothetical protein EG68_09479 [Paragonimus skrjabini miyazakii]|uniref:Uncharacterized protein n=1 Tax=Paragonimus skrjabini miyazakii TaxID=59628 RepID=A0A8S9YLB1_9TREM|nr:hypothetical protein EG68_09479 [Paragonimus skrjabini miyazakii]
MLNSLSFNFGAQLNSRVFYWSLGQSLLIILVGIGQHHSGLCAYVIIQSPQVARSSGQFYNRVPILAKRIVACA